MSQATDAASAFDWNSALLEQLTWHWDNHLRPRLASLTDEEYFWEPVAGCWNVRPRGSSTAQVQAGSGAMTIDFAFEEPTPAPVTTIAWRLGHILVGVLGERNAAHFNGPPCDYPTFEYAATADQALAQLDEAYDLWLSGVRGLGGAEVPGEGLMRACGPAEGPFAEATMAELVIHIHRELIHHGAEIALLRDLYAHRS
jgi:DinB superfamily